MDKHTRRQRGLERQVMAIAKRLEATGLQACETFAMADAMVAKFNGLHNQVEIVCTLRAIRAAFKTAQDTRDRLTEALAKLERLLDVP